MSNYAWPGFNVAQFELSILQNLRTFVGPYTPTVQVLDLFGERWQGRVTLGDLGVLQDGIAIAAIEAFFDRLKGQANSFSLGHLKRPRPNGTLGPAAAFSWTWTGGAFSWTWTGGAFSWTSGDPLVAVDIAQLATTATLSTLPGRTLLAGDHLGLGGQLVRVMANATANGSGLLTVEFQPRARTLIPAGTPVVWDSPTANFILKPGTLSVPTTWTPESISGASFEFIEVY